LICKYRFETQKGGMD